MPNLELRVTVKDGSLDVDQSGNGNQMGHGQSGTIVWKLVGTAANGTFNAMNATNPGFAWEQPVPDGVFGPPSLANSDKDIEMSDTNTDPNGVNSTGSWIYQLYATIDGTQYSTIASLPNPKATTTNPKIINS
ncbi:MAG TPA: hypothetical protein VHD89_02430 [Rhodanobacteraceae bacterium]|jgi:hypothetical protein|nr:hypothetical protein [Rhodanobacteraceae bacterium]